MRVPLRVQVSYGKGQFEFRLHQRELDFGAPGKAEYFWMDSRQFRSKSAGGNFRACIDLWWTAVEEAGAAGELDNQINLVWAECYPLVSTARTLQDIYIDAHLHKRADRQEPIANEVGPRGLKWERCTSLTDQEVNRLRQLAASRDVRAIRAELEDLFLGELPSAEEMPAYQDAVRSWIGEGLRTLRTAGRAGLKAYVSTVGKWMRAYRKQGNRDRERRFLNMFSYESKVAFYLCYTSAWVALVRQLKANGRLNVTGERFLRLWHNQNQPTEDETAERGGNRDVFCGQVLALHPLSAIVQNDPIHLIRIGSWLAHPDYDVLHETGRVGTSNEYWDVMATILVGAHEYDQTRRRWEATRDGITYNDAEAVNAAPRDDADTPFAQCFEDLAAARNLACPQCRGTLSYARHAALDDDEQKVQIDYRCSSGHDFSLTITEDDLREFLYPEL